MTPLISRKMLHVQPQEIGKIKLGGRGAARKTSGGGESFIPQKYDHFQVTTMEREGGKGPFMRDEAVHAIVGDKPRELEAILMYPEVEQNIMTLMRAGKRRAAIKCDGEVQVNQQGKQSPCAKLTGGQCECKPYCRLQVQLVASPHTGGYYVFRTRGWSTTNNLQTFLEETYARFGTLYQAPVKLMTFQSEDQYQQDGRDQVGKSWKVAMVLNMNYEAAAEFMVGQKQRLDTVRELLLLSAGEVQNHLDEEDEEDAEALDDEFNPPKGVEASVATQERLDEVVAGLQPVDAPGPDAGAVGTHPVDIHEGETKTVALGTYEVKVDDDDENALANLVMDLRDEAEQHKLLDRTAKQFIKDALESKTEENLDKARRALERLLGPPEE
jgi:hypothetical protein